MKNTPQTRSRHGLRALKARVKVRGFNAVDRRTAAAQSLLAWKNELLRDLGEDVSSQKRALVDLAARTKLYIDHLDAWLFEQPTLVLKRKRAILPALRERQSLVDSLSRLLAQLGLERVPKRVPPLNEYLTRADSSCEQEDSQPK